MGNTWPIAAPLTAADVTPHPRLKLNDPRWSLAFLGILAYLVIEYTRLPMMFPVLIGLHVGKVAVLIALVGLLFSARLDPALRAQCRKLDTWLVAFLLCALASAFLAADQPAAWDTIGLILRWVLIYWLVARIVSSRWRLRVFLLLLVLLNLKLAQFQIRSYLTHKALGADETDLAMGLGVGSFGFFSNSNDFGVAMCVVWPLAALLLLCERGYLWRLLLGTAFVLFVTALLLSGSRGAIVGAVATALVAAVRSSSRRSGLIMVVLLVLSTLYLLPEANQERLRSALDWQNDRNAITRLNLWQAGLEMFAHNPVLGVGPGNFPQAYLRTNTAANAPWKPRAFAPHSIYVQALSEVGVAGSLCLLMICILAFRINLQTCRRAASTPRDRSSLEYCLAAGLNLALVGYVVSGAFITVLYYPHLWFLLGLSSGLSAASLRGQEDASLSQTLPAAPPSWAAVQAGFSRTAVGPTKPAWTCGRNPGPRWE